MKVEIYRIQLTHLRNSEYCMFVSQLVVIFLKFDAELLHLKKSFDRLVALLPDLDKVRAQEQGSIYSNLVSDLNIQRTRIFVALVKQVKNLEKSGIASFATHVNLLNGLLDKHGRDIATANYNSKTKRLNDFLNDTTSSDEISAAISGLNLSLLVDELRNANNEFASKYIVRIENDTEIEAVDTHAIRTETDKALLDFFNAFEFCSVEYDELDYKTPALKLNEHISHYKTELKARETRRKNGKDTSTEAPIAPKA